MTSGLGKGIRGTLERLNKTRIALSIEPPKELTQEQLEMEAYQRMKQAWYFHPSSWHMRHDNGDDGIGCSGLHCTPECEFFPAAGKLQLNENGSYSITH